MDNPWPEVFGEFSAKIKEKMNPGSYDGVTASFSTTGSVEKAAGDIIFMDMVKNYFEILMRTCCGIPEVTLEGTAEDWALIRDKVESLKSKYGLEWWLKELYPVVSGMADCASGKQDGTFLQEWYKLGGGSGGPYVSGHIVKFFPYLKDRNGEAKRKVTNFNPGIHFGGPNTDAFTAGLNSVPFIWQYLGDLKNMRLSAGFVGYTQDQQTMAVRPKIGWAVYEEDAPIISEFVKTCTKCGKQKMKEEFMPFGDETECLECYRKKYS
jgi:hypothetical protein